MYRLASLLLASLALASLWPRPALAETYPARPIKIVAGTLPGGQSDRLARLVGEPLAQLYGQPVVIENRAGADGTIAADAVAHAAPDGYTLLLAGSNLALVAARPTTVAYDPVTAFAAVGRIAYVPLVLAINARMAAATLADLIAIAKSRTGHLTYASTGSQTRLAGELLKASAHVDIIEVPYKGAPPALADLLAERIDMMFVDLSIVLPHVQAGTLRLLAAAGSRRAAAAPNVPTLAEAGVQGFAVEPWYGLVAPAATPPETLAKLRNGLAKVRQNPEVRQHLAQLGYEPIDDTAEQMAAQMIADIERFARLLKSAGIGGRP